MGSISPETLGQEWAERVLENALANDRVAGAYLFSGPEGVGKYRVAVDFAARLLSSTTDADVIQAARTRIVDGRHPDARIFGPRDDGNHNLPIEVVREMVLPFVKFAPFEGARAVVIFRSAEVCFPENHAQAANALLKSIEEPKKGLHFIFIAEQPNRLLPTIRSRCQNVSFARLADKDVETVLVRHGPSDAPATARQSAAALADGSAARALQLLEQGGTQVVDDAIALLRLSARAWPQAVEALAKHAQRSLMLRTMLLVARDLEAMAVDAAPKLALHHTALESLRNELKHSLLGFEEWAVETEDALQSNASADLVFADLLLKASGRAPFHVRRHPLER